MHCSNYCQSCLDCLLANASIVPAVNQFELHVGMGDDPEGLVSYTARKGIVVQVATEDCLVSCRAVRRLDR